MSTKSEVVERLMGLVQEYGLACFNEALSDESESSHVRRVAETKRLQAELRTLLTAAVPVWREIADAPTSEPEPFIVLRKGLSDCAFCEMQVSRFQGDLYPDHMGSNIDYGDRITDAIAWRPALPPPPTEAETK